MEERTRYRERPKVSARPSHAGECTFCGAPMSPGQTVCDECGMPSSGLTCPVCGALNFRPFCSRCGSPLNRAASAAVEKAKNDPAFMKVNGLLKKAAELKEKMQSSRSEGTAEFMKMFSSGVSSGEESDLKEEYGRTVRDIDRLFSEMLPPAGSTPQQQMNYYCARNVAVTVVVQDKVTVKSPVAWICNYCGCRHRYPSECAEPFHGGTWVYEERVVTERIEKKEIKQEE